jgi:hypothetical protein
MGKFRLLSKREVDKAKSIDRKREIDEGMKLAKRVDTLRETAVKEEKGLDDFRRQQLEAIQAQIDPKIVELDALAGEIRRLKVQREALLVPLQEREAEVFDNEQQLRQRDEEITQKEAQLKLAISANIQRERENRLEQQRTEDAKKRATEFLVETQEDHRQAQEVLKNANEKSSLLNAALDLREKEVRKREEDATLAMNAANEYQKKLQKYENRLFLSEQKLKNGWKDLLASQIKEQHG